MKLSDYQKTAMEFRMDSANYDYALLGLVGEVGELYGKLAKEIRDGTIVNRKDIAKEIGDVLWFVAALCEDFELNLEDVAEMNIAKLTSRSVRGAISGSGDDR